MDKHALLIQKGGGSPPPLLSTQAKAFDKGPVTHNIFFFEVVEESTPLTNQGIKTTAGMVVILVGAEMLGQMVDSPCEKSDLYLRRTRVVFMKLVLRNYLLFLFLR
jgi:hypothetical protein